MHAGSSPICPRSLNTLGRQLKNKAQLIASLLSVIAELHREPAGGFDAAIGQETDDDDLLDAVLLELLVEINVGKATSTARAATTITAMVLLSVRQNVNERNRPCVK